MLIISQSADAALSLRIRKLRVRLRSNVLILLSKSVLSNLHSGDFSLVKNQLSAFCRLVHSERSIKALRCCSKIDLRPDVALFANLQRRELALAEIQKLLFLMRSRCWHDDERGAKKFLVGIDKYMYIEPWWQAISREEWGVVHSLLFAVCFSSQHSRVKDKNTSNLWHKSCMCVEGASGNCLPPFQF